ncbi:MAG TPA: NifB/NifX family molybdenum-iron cluster-binding protein [Candidatus Hydrogenedentes bacterium]|mgnify:CR=1 FL=1|nr:NifB/NifX family molybdenum-iron cluster-binding protein [Deltaproteobacteria bacterium]HOF40686.1 NifB/NifX family molybdenum-iron cluster-binding protein [Candidatus Hydrogenedentota bacterium]
MKKIAVCELNGRIAPLYDTTSEFAIFSIDERGRILERWTMNVGGMTSAEQTAMLGRLGVEVVICGGAKQECQCHLREHHIRFFDNVIGNVADVLARYLEGTLRSGEVIN